MASVEADRSRSSVRQDLQMQDSLSKARSALAGSAVRILDNAGTAVRSLDNAGSAGVHTLEDDNAGNNDASSGYNARLSAEAPFVGDGGRKQSVDGRREDVVDDEQEVPADSFEEARASSPSPVARAVARGLGGIVSEFFSGLGGRPTGGGRQYDKG